MLTAFLSARISPEGNPIKSYDSISHVFSLFRSLKVESCSSKNFSILYLAAFVTAAGKNIRNLATFCFIVSVESVDFNDGQGAREPLLKSSGQQGDAPRDRLLLSGIDATTKTQHVVYGAPADGCGPFTKVGAYGAAGYLPMLHASALDADGQRLFVTVMPTKGAAAIGIIDLTGAAEMTVVAEGTPDPDDVLIGLHFDAKAKKLIGIVAAQALEFHSLDVEAQAWETPKPLAGVPSTLRASRSLRYGSYHAHSSLYPSVMPMRR